MAYDAATTRNFFDQYGDREWERFGGRAQDSVNLHIHIHYLTRYVAAGMSVLDAGAGPGRFTIELARIGAEATVFDLSPEMLDQNRRRVAAAGFERSVTAREQGDITDLSRFEDDSFEAVVCYGGPLSYVMERADEALGELLRVAKPNAPVLLSVMSTLGGTRAFLPAVLELSAEIGSERVLRVLDDGLLIPGLLSSGHYMKMYRWQELEELLARHPCQLEAASASSFLTTARAERIEDLCPDESSRQALLDWELRCSREDGALDGGTHILAVVRKVAAAAGRLSSGDAR
jgi:ubiquinone/menaquinone biosynthesis C-methylase UbiE